MVTGRAKSRILYCSLSEADIASFFVKKKTGNVLFGSKTGCAIMVTGRAKSRILYCSLSEAGVGVSIGDRAQVC
jgi:hypothetical protein